MSRFPERNLNQKAVYWGGPVDDGFGKFTFSEAPIEIDCRWTETIEVIKSGDGSQVTSTTQVHVKVDLEENGMLFLGLLTDLSSAQLADPYECDSAYQIIRFDKTPTLVRSSRKYRLAYL